MNIIQSQRLLGRLGVTIRRAWLSALATVRRDSSAASVAAERFATAVSAAFLQAGALEVEHLVVAVFDQSVVADFLSSDRRRLTQNFLSTVARATSGLLPLGISASQVRTLTAFRAALQSGSTDVLSNNSLRDRRFDRAIRSGRILSNEEVNLMVNRYGERLAANRARVIGSSEALVAMNGAFNEVHRQTTQAGIELPQRIWVTASDEKVRSTHSSMQGQRQFVGQPFISGAGGRLFFPGDPRASANETVNCRCVLISEAPNA